ncbi:MAG: 2-C-methyl-D-erythritol 2,4-cyclodiphosphate synthase [Firmicutes bacterium]|nr:2-C-methyl-D-erythritol 2,4-cyclodiphosphate synthase [Bacillota bacterium]
MDKANLKTKHAVIVCAGKAKRSGLSYNKVFFRLDKKSVLETVLEKFLHFDKVVVVVADSEIKAANDLLKRAFLNEINAKKIIVAKGGGCRSQSVLNGLIESGDCGIVAIHDGARPFVGKNLIDTACDFAFKTGSAIPALKVTDSIKSVDGQNNIVKTIKKESLYSVQTPQVFDYKKITKAYFDVFEGGDCTKINKRFLDENFEDDSQIYLAAGFSPFIFDGETSNKKLTNPDDFCLEKGPFGGWVVFKGEVAGKRRTNCDGFSLNKKHPKGQTEIENSAASALPMPHPKRSDIAKIGSSLDVHRLKSNRKLIIDGEKNTAASTLPMPCPKHSDIAKIGTGFDVHRLVKKRKLILGGVEIPFKKGLLGHSDADVLTHAVMDALLSAANLPDIGTIFPDTDPKFEGASSIGLLHEVKKMLDAAGTKILSVSAVVIAQRPKLAGFIGQIRQSLSEAMGIEVDCVNISATTTEFVGTVGKGKSIASSAVVLLG